MSEYFANFRNSALHPCKLYKYRCVAGYLTVMIHPNGNVFSCPVAFEKVGNILEKPLSEIWYKDMQDLREKIKKGKHPICWFDCIAPISLLMSYSTPLKWHKLFEPAFIRHLIHKSF
jgi:MoaA/NifB/PqqE/SkfB family radical SAM enzyme